MAPRAPKRQAKADPLKVYKEKRDFSRTPEPSAALGVGEGREFVVQKHDARRLHFDLRLELGGTLKSWAITRGLASPGPLLRQLWRGPALAATER